MTRGGTVGFIRDLPPDLITAFRATLEEMEGSNVLIHLVDGSSAHVDDHIAALQRAAGLIGVRAPNR